jgi:hypothetical protein
MSQFRKGPAVNDTTRIYVGKSRQHANDMTTSGRRTAFAMKTVLTSAWDIPPDGPFQLGSIVIMAGEPFDLNGHGIIPVPSPTITSTTSEPDARVLEFLHPKRRRPSLWYRILRSLGAHPETHTSSQSSEDMGMVTVARMEKIQFNPSKEYIEQRLRVLGAPQEVAGRHWRWRKVYMITTIIIVRASALRETQSFSDTLDFIVAFGLKKIKLRRFEDLYVA